VHREPADRRRAEQHQRGGDQKGRPQTGQRRQLAPGQRAERLAAGEDDLVDAEAAGPHPVRQEELQRRVHPGHQRHPGQTGHDERGGHRDAVGHQGDDDQSQAVGDTGEHDQPIRCEPGADQRHEQGAGDRADTKGGRQYAVPAGAHAQFPVCDQRQQAPDHAAGQHEEHYSAEQPAHDRRVAHVAAARTQRRTEPLGVTRALLRRAPPAHQS